MSVAIDLLNELAALGIEVRARENRLRFRPADAVSPELLERMRDQKPALLALLALDPQGDPREPVSFPEHYRVRMLVASVRDSARPAEWITGDWLDRLPECLRDLVMPRPGWTPVRWAAYLWRRARRCDDRHRATAELYTHAAALLTGGGRRETAESPASPDPLS